MSSPFNTALDLSASMVTVALFRPMTPMAIGGSPEFTVQTGLASAAFLEYLSLMDHPGKDAPSTSASISLPWTPKLPSGVAVSVSSNTTKYEVLASKVVLAGAVKVCFPLVSTVPVSTTRLESGLCRRLRSSRC